MTDSRRGDRVVALRRAPRDFLIFRIAECEFRVHTVPETPNGPARSYVVSVRQSRSSLAIKQHREITGQTFRKQDYRERQTWMRMRGHNSFHAASQ